MKKTKIYLTAPPGQLQAMIEEKEFIERETNFSVIIGTGDIKNRAMQMVDCEKIYLMKGWDDFHECITEFQLSVILGLKSII